MEISVSNGRDLILIYDTQGLPRLLDSGPKLSDHARPAAVHMGLWKGRDANQWRLTEENRGWQILSPSKPKQIKSGLHMIPISWSSCNTV
jgi:hypothetical protein